MSKDRDNWKSNTRREMALAALLYGLLLLWVIGMAMGKAWPAHGFVCV